MASFSIFLQKYYIYPTDKEIDLSFLLPLTLSLLINLSSIKALFDLIFFNFKTRLCYLTDFGEESIHKCTVMHNSLIFLAGIQFEKKNIRKEK